MTKFKKFKRWKIKKKIIQKRNRVEQVKDIEVNGGSGDTKVKVGIKSKIVHHFRRNKMKLITDILNTTITLIVSILLLGAWGILVAFIPDIMLVFIISDIWQKNPKNKLISWKLEIHLFLHSIIFMSVLGISLIVIMLMLTEGFNIAWRIVVSLVIHIIIDQVTHSEEYGGHFRGYSRSNYKKPVDTEIIE